MSLAQVTCVHSLSFNLLQCLISCCADLNALKFSQVIDLLDKKMKSMNTKLLELHIRLEALTREGDAAGEDTCFVSKLDLALILSLMVTCPCLRVCVSMCMHGSSSACRHH